ncbi:MAG: hypothetical protein HC859_08475 [Bacteroidia bacterium]|nr:hypothetical protein [Bacteroidia bacterium]
MLLGQKHHDHGKLDATLKVYLDSVLKSRPIPANWAEGYEAILDSHLGKAPERFLYGEKQYTPLSFAREVLHFDASDYVYITSFSHHPFYKTFVVEIPDNWANVSYYNVPLNDMMSMAETAITKGFSLMWDADVSNAGFDQRNGYAMQFEKEKPKEIDPDALRRNTIRPFVRNFLKVSSHKTTT